ncbi:hypothetical protein A3I95_03305 [Candidatus Nomurabacteria bacterium RIFCSPLOWO2_02_FULL_44_12]|uniref:Metallo-beta-lactamase domain-containing protein n=1 Tax=Candidatus Nomurabacteria bacterium RIFCSPLOWO2_12_FULL_44_11 TaxID=1801796 RepID=A0A1F6Y7M8_9BACT|nr:MAG: hypothetical protein A3E95_03035 [Candidatus Nomurabacteria bacterium RIFCSPHIGHO2_12_FULL_44_22b]OGJ02381.1 MAG: hypothetical protein A3G53_00280 [Candidatus Nomurabacteria bacterium RIFCSPLOWO2_12_FULL_44_11]OGJ07625.1 MAG: hypothetical protein A3I95_03305 [Candidatus Nomurabacteria bacterium RIFCSPLOWO2_02_FULL_44_12]
MSKITIIFDNNKDNEKLSDGFGFSCLVEFQDKKILFDTGGNRDAFFGNIEKLNINLQTITHIVFSHKHLDHLAGFDEVLSKTSNAQIFLPDFFSEKLVQKIPKSSNINMVKLFSKVSANIFLLPLAGSYDSKEIHEQSLILDTPNGLVVVTGCAHPGIVEILNKTKEKFPGKKIHLVLGGFHFYKSWFWISGKAVKQFIKLGVGKVAPCHCTGPKAEKQFKKVYTENFIKVGTGTVITI